MKYKKLMVIDDNHTDIYIIKALIKNNKIAEEILEFNNGLDAFKYLENNNDVPENLPEIILLDIYMPLMDGFQFMEAYSKIESKSSKKCKICIISSSIDDNDILRTKMDKNVYSFASKPLTLEFLKSL